MAGTLSRITTRMLSRIRITSTMSKRRPAGVSVPKMTSNMRARQPSGGRPSSVGRSRGGVGTNLLSFLLSVARIIWGRVPPAKANPYLACCSTQAAKAAMNFWKKARDDSSTSSSPSYLPATPPT